MTISLVDYAVFIFSLSLSVCTGVYHAIRAYYSKSELSKNEEYMMGGKNMPAFPVALSLLTTFLSGILMLGVPAEMFQRGANIWMNFIVGVIASLLTATIFLPVFYKMKVICLHEYFELRFNSQLIRKTFSALFIIQSLCYMSIVIYAPAVALSKIVQIDKWILILIFGMITTLYTTIGGLKAVVWTDSLQALLMYGGVFTLVYVGLQNPKVGGFNRVWNIAYNTGRIQDAWRNEFTIFQYNNLWINLFSGTIIWLAAFGVNQLAVQRYFSLPRFSDATKIIYHTIIPFLLLCSLVAFIGFIALAYYFNCNPLETGEINDSDQLIILFAREVLTPTRGLFGLYVSCIMSATLSTLSSGMNSMAAAIYEDFFKKNLYGKISDAKTATMNKIIVMTIGILSTSLAYSAEPLGGILRVCISVMGATGGPFVGIFVLAMFWPKAGEKSTFISFVSSCIIMMIICIINYIEDPYGQYFLETNSTREGCKNINFTRRALPPYDAYYGNPEKSLISRISTYSYPGIGMIIMLIIGASLTHFWKEQNPEEIKHLTFYGRHLSMRYKIRLSQSLCTEEQLNQRNNKVEKF